MTVPRRSLPSAARSPFNETIGYADRANETLLSQDNVFPVFSISKALTAVALLQRVERGEARLDTPVCEVIPEFGVKGKARATLGQLLCHTAGVAPGFPAVPADKQGNLEAVVAAVCTTPAVSVPGEEASYSQIMAHAVAAECVRRLDGSGLRFRDIVRRDILAPLGMMDTCLGMRADLAARGIVPCCTDRSPGLFDPDALVAAAQDIMNPALDHEMPAAGFVSTLNDMYAFSEALRGGGKRGEARVLSPAMVAFATEVHTGTMINTQWHFAREMKGWPAFPANLGLGFFIRGEGMIPTYFGHLSSPETFGAFGAGSTNMWVDPTRDMIMVCLTTGILEETNSAARFQRLSDIAIAEYYR